MTVKGEQPISVSYILAGEKYSAKARDTWGHVRREAESDGIQVEQGEECIFVPITMIHVALAAGKHTAKLKKQGTGDAKSK
jgi:hypothetical protein